MFQPRTVTDRSLVFIANVTSYLSPSHRLNCFLDHSLPVSVSRLPSHPPPLDCAAPLFAPNSPPSSGLGLPVHLEIFHSRWPPPPIPALAVLPPLTCSPGPCRPLQPCAASPFLQLFPTSGRPPFAALDVDNVPVNPYEFALLGSILHLPFLKPLLPSAVVDLRPGTF